MSGRGAKVLDMNTVGERQTIRLEARSVQQGLRIPCLRCLPSSFQREAATSSLLGLRSCSAADVT